MSYPMQNHTQPEPLLPHKTQVHCQKLQIILQLALPFPLQKAQDFLTVT